MLHSGPMLKTTFWQIAGANTDFFVVLIFYFTFSVREAKASS